jgi:hypothetical protein
MRKGGAKRGGGLLGMDDINVELPWGVDLATGSMIQVLPSVTAVAMKFVFDDVTTKCFQDILWETPATVTQPMVKGSGRFIFTPLMQKARRVAEARASLRTRCEYWYNKYLPGVFSANQFAARFPACEFVTLSKGSPYTDSEERNRYLGLLGLDRTYDAWRCENIPALKLGWRTFLSTGNDYLTLAANEAELAAWAKEHDYPVSPSHFAITRLEEFDDWLVSWSLRGLSEHHFKSVFALRDEALRATKGRWFSRALQRTQAELQQLRPNVVSFAEDVTSMRKGRELLPRTEFRFESLDQQRKSNRELLEQVLERVDFETERLLQGIRSVTDDFMTSVNLRHQAALTWYTLIIVILTVLLLVLEIRSSAEKSQQPATSHTSANGGVGSIPARGS